MFTLTPIIHESKSVHYICDHVSLRLLTIGRENVVHVDLCTILYICVTLYVCVYTARLEYILTVYSTIVI